MNYFLKNFLYFTVFIVLINGALFWLYNSEIDSKKQREININNYKKNVTDWKSIEFELNTLPKDFNEKTEIKPEKVFENPTSLRASILEVIRKSNFKVEYDDATPRDDIFELTVKSDSPEELLNFGSSIEHRAFNTENFKGSIYRVGDDFKLTMNLKFYRKK